MLGHEAMHCKHKHGWYIALQFTAFCMAGSKTKQYCVCYKMSSVLYKNIALWLTNTVQLLVCSKNKPTVILSQTRVHGFLSPQLIHQAS